jgi:hypothetical protein
MPPGERDAFLRTTARARLAQLAAIVDGAARPWIEAAPTLRPPDPIAEDWYRP